MKKLTQIALIISLSSSSLLGFTQNQAAPAAEKVDQLADQMASLDQAQQQRLLERLQQRGTKLEKNNKKAEKIALGYAASAGVGLALPLTIDALGLIIGGNKYSGVGFKAYLASITGFSGLLGTVNMYKTLTSRNDEYGLTVK